MKALVIDPKTSGISGDMLLASLIDLTASPEILEPLAGALQGLPNCTAFNYQAKKVRSGVISAQRLHIELQEKKLCSMDELDAIAGN
ncbi:MAG: pyridinium-3,5-bisthiocarboxylic acid mononucleotide nickel chelatase, partial [Euryarchaeota archaeon]|nr:pyridinium-3,5-bisthiocarboxylic acid mononucleotide nickel chelatase [Euryarchaeota archaeon]